MASGKQHSVEEGKCSGLGRPQIPARNPWMLPHRQAVFADVIQLRTLRPGAEMQGIVLGYLCESYIQPLVPYKTQRGWTTQKKEGPVTQRKTREKHHRKPQKQRLFPGASESSQTQEQFNLCPPLPDFRLLASRTSDNQTVCFPSFHCPRNQT